MNIEEQLRLLREGAVSRVQSSDDIINEAFDNINLLESLTGDYSDLNDSLSEGVMTESVTLVDKIFDKIFDKTKKLEKLLNDTDLSKYKDLDKNFHKLNTINIHVNYRMAGLINRRKYLENIIDNEMVNIDKVVSKFQSGEMTKVTSTVLHLTNILMDIKNDVEKNVIAPYGKYSISSISTNGSYEYTKDEIKRWMPTEVTKNRAEYIKDTIKYRNRLNDDKKKAIQAISKVDSFNFINKAQIKMIIKKTIDLEIYIVNKLLDTLLIAFQEDIHILNQINSKVNNS